MYRTLAIPSPSLKTGSAKGCVYEGVLLVTRPWISCDRLGHEQSGLTLFIGRSRMTHTLGRLKRVSSVLILPIRLK